MKESMNEVFLGIGGNKGRRKENIEKALQEINLHLGKVIKKSLVYETQPWGSKSKNLYLNLVVKIETSLPLKTLHQKILEIEEKLGRKRTKDQNSDRTIDIDILFYKQEIHKSKSLQVPHPRLHLRNFVLQPLLDIDPNFNHPVLNKTIKQLYKSSPDKLKINLYKPLKPIFICIEGNIGVGKTTLAKSLAKKYGYKFVGEKFANNPLLPLFYEDPKAFAFALEWSFLLSRFKQIYNKSKAQHKIYICDFSFMKSLWFASVNLNRADFIFFKQQYDLLQSQVPKPDLLIYLQTSSQHQSANIISRGRPFEKRIKRLYLEKIDKAYNEGISQLVNVPIQKILIKSYDKNNEFKLIKSIDQQIKDKFVKLSRKI